MYYCDHLHNHSELEKAAEALPAKLEKPIPPPAMKSKKKRGDSKVRRIKEIAELTQARKLQNRAAFGREEAEIIVGSSVVGMGMLSNAKSGKLRAPPIDNKEVDKFPTRSIFKYIEPSCTSSSLKIQKFLMCMEIKHIGLQNRVYYTYGEFIKFPSPSGILWIMGNFYLNVENTNILSKFIENLLTYFIEHYVSVFPKQLRFNVIRFLTEVSRQTRCHLYLGQPYIFLSDLGQLNPMHRFSIGTELINFWIRM